MLLHCGHHVIEIIGVNFYRLDTFLVAQPWVSNHWRKLKALTPSCDNDALVLSCRNPATWLLGKLRRAASLCQLFASSTQQLFCPILIPCTQYGDGITWDGDWEGNSHEGLGRMGKIVWMAWGWDKIIYYIILYDLSHCWVLEAMSWHTDAARLNFLSSHVAGSRQDKTSASLPLDGVSALSFLRWFDTVAWATRKVSNL